MGVNGFIATRGISGSTTGYRRIVQALATTVDVIAVAPSTTGKNRLTRLSRMVAWDLAGAANATRKAGGDVIVHTANTGLPGLGVKSVVVMHDTMVLDHSALFDPGYVRFAQGLFGVSVQAASIVITPSQHSRRCVLRRWPTADVRVIPWSSPPESKPVLTAEQLSEQTTERSLRRASNCREVLIVASSDRHKRLPLALDVIHSARELSGIDIRATFVTRAGNGDTEFRQAVEALGAAGRWVKVHDRVDQPTLESLYRRADALLVTSLDEGFCLPVVEAANFGVPAVHTGRGALEEFIGSEDPPPPANPADDQVVLLSRLLELLNSGDAPTRPAPNFTIGSDWAEFCASWTSVVGELR